MKTRFPNDAGILAIDLAKHSFQVCAATSNGDVLYNRTFTRPRIENFLKALSSCPVAMEACSMFRTVGASLWPQATSYA